MRNIPNNGNLKKVAYPLGLCLFICIAYIKWHWVSTTQAFFSITEAVSGDHRRQQAGNPLGMVARGHKVFYGIVFDVGSTGISFNSPGSLEVSCLGQKALAVHCFFLFLSQENSWNHLLLKMVVSQGVG